MAQPTARKLSDYKVPDFLIDSVALTFQLEPQNTRVINLMKVRRNGAHSAPLVLDGEGLTGLSISIDGQPVSDYVVDEKSLTLGNVPSEFVLEINNTINPEANTSLEGLYVSSGAFCTQCEAEGFRKITYFLDRPDVMSVYQVRIEADASQYPQLLSNGNKVESGLLANGRHYVVWQDPFKKPCYLFALVAGDFDLVADDYTTQTGRKIDLELYVDKGNAYRGQHALESLKKAMLWDEQTFGLEYDLDVYMIVAVDFFNMGAMENKGLNIFNSKYVLADPKSATDEDYFNIESIIAHEYFHNWTGNRVTCRDWFQLSLKEGLTVFRDQQFSSDMSSPVTNRIKMVKVIRDHQFAEDAGPMAHPIRPESVIEMNNFYTVTVYDKGAEVIRMMHTMLGEQSFRAGMDLYFERHDGQAVTCDDFVQAMQDASGVDLGLFKCWYSQSGTPVITAEVQFDETNQTVQILLQQTNPVTADQASKQEMHIPIQYEVFADDGSGKKEFASGIHHLRAGQDKIELSNVDHKPNVVLLGNFSAPVKLQFERDLTQLQSAIINANDGFSRWDSAQALYSKLIWQLADSQQSENSALVAEIERTLKMLVRALEQQQLSDLALEAELITLPSFETLAEQRDLIPVDDLYFARKQVAKLLSLALADYAEQKLPSLTCGKYRYDTGDNAKRYLKNNLLHHLLNAGKAPGLAVSAYEEANNMTDQLGALKALRHTNTSVFDQLMVSFEQAWHRDVLVLDKWFSLHAGTHRQDILARLQLLKSHPEFTMSNPNRVRAVIGTFAFFNVIGFHNLNGEGYRFVADHIIQLNDLNPQVASRLITPFLQWKRFENKRRGLMQHELMRIGDHPSLSRDLYEKVSKSLN